jgi:uncharacterized protein YdhG (YjbR/CyaY superfamily)
MEQTMKATRARPADIDEYIAGFSPEVRAILQQVRATVRAAAPSAREIISYQMPTFTLDGVLVHFAAFKAHIGLYPPVRGDRELEAAVAPYAGEKGNLKFPLAQPIPYDLIERIVRYKLEQNAARAAAKGKRAR